MMNPEMLAALAGLPPLPRTPLTINPCPEGYNLQLVGGQFMCVLEEPSPEDILAMRRNQMGQRFGQQGSRFAPNPFEQQGGLEGGAGP